MAASFAEAAKEPAMRSVMLAMLMLAAVQAISQDPLKVDPGHFNVEFENDQVRVVRVHFDPHYILD
jgi:polyisoprenoid-binding protein YceI